MTKVSLIKEFRSFAIVTIMGVATLIGASSWNEYKEQTKEITIKLQNAVARVDRNFTYSLKHTDYILHYIAEQIEGRWEDYLYIDSILQTLRTDQEVNTTLSWNMFSWSDQYHQARVNSVRRILNPPIDISSMSNMPASMAEPGILHLGKPIIGTISKQWLIPASIGVVDSQNRYKGAIGIGLNIEGIERKIEGIIDKPNVTFALIDERFNQAVVRSHKEINSQESFVMNALKNIDISTHPEGLLATYHLFSISDFIFYHKIAESPYILLLSYKGEVFQENLFKLFQEHLLRYTIIGILILGLLTMLYKRLINPVADLSNAADRIAKGEKNVSISQSEYYEVDNLGQKIQKITEYIEEIQSVKDTLKLAKEEVEQAHQELEEANTELKILNENLEERVATRTQELEEALEAKRLFVRNMNHELKTPFQGVCMLAEDLLRIWDAPDEALKKEVVKEIARSGRRLRSLLLDLTDSSKFETGQMTFNMENQAILPIIREIFEEHRVLNKNHKPLQFALSANIPEDTVIFCDQVRIGQVVRNMLANAIQYSQEGHITIAVFLREFRHEDDTLHSGVAISISDEGIGIPDNEIKTIFQPFTMSSRTQSLAGGTGLGLHIARSIVEAHGGIIWAENNVVKGSTFTMILPVISKAA